MSITWPKNIPIHLWFCTILIALLIFFHLLGFGGYIGLSYKAGQYGNQWVPFWTVTLGLLIDFQTCYMLYKCWKKKSIQRKIVWTIFCAWMFVMALMIMIGDAIISSNGEITGYNGVPALWSATWFIALLVMINITWLEHIQHLCHKKVSSDSTASSTIVDEKLPPIFPTAKTERSPENEGERLENTISNPTTRKPTKSSPCCHRRCCTLKCTMNGIGWSSIGFLSIFGFLLALQTVWSANDVLNYGPLGQRVTNVRCKSSGTNVGACCIRPLHGGQLILSPLERAKSQL